MARVGRSVHGYDESSDPNWQNFVSEKEAREYLKGKYGIERDNISV
jgi:hypothetical protein